MQLPSPYRYTDCSASYCQMNEAKPGVVFGLEKEKRAWRVFYKRNGSRGYKSTWILCPGHDAELMRDFEAIGQQEVDTYEATMRYYQETEDRDTSTQAS